MSPKTISVIVPVYNSMNHLQTCLDSIMKAIEQYGNAKLIIVDHGSTDGSYELLVGEYSGSAEIFRIEGGTVAFLRNEGARHSTADYLSFTDSDMLVDPDYLQSAAALFDSIGTDVIVAAFGVPPSSTWIAKAWNRLHWSVPDGFTNLYGGTFMIKRPAFVDVGGFNTDLITDEDTDLGSRLNRAGYKTYRSASFACVHLGEPQTLGAFVRRQAWHGLGMFTDSGMNKPLLMTILHLVLSVLGVVSTIVTSMGVIDSIFVLILSSLAVPAVTVAYRFYRIKAIMQPVRSLLLYYLYYSARIISMFRFVLMRLHRKPPAQYSPRSRV